MHFSNIVQKWGIKPMLKNKTDFVIAFDIKLTYDWHIIYLELTQKDSLRVELFRFKGIVDIVPQIYALFCQI